MCVLGGGGGGAGGKDSPILGAPKHHKEGGIDERLCAVVQPFSYYADTLGKILYPSLNKFFRD